MVIGCCFASSSFMISTYGDESTIAMALERGARRFLTKPVDFVWSKQGVLVAMADKGRNG